MDCSGCLMVAKPPILCPQSVVADGPHSSKTLMNTVKRNDECKNTMNELRLHYIQYNKINSITRYKMMTNSYSLSHLYVQIKPNYNTTKPRSSKKIPIFSIKKSCGWKNGRRI